MVSVSCWPESSGVECEGYCQAEELHCGLKGSTVSLSKGRKIMNLVDGGLCCLHCQRFRWWKVGREER